MEGRSGLAVIAGLPINHIEISRRCPSCFHGWKNRVDLKSACLGTTRHCSNTQASGSGLSLKSSQSKYLKNHHPSRVRVNEFLMSQENWGSSFTQQQDTDSLGSGTGTLPEPPWCLLKRRRVDGLWRSRKQVCVHACCCKCALIHAAASVRSCMQYQGGQRPLWSTTCVCERLVT